MYRIAVALLVLSALAVSAQAQVCTAYVNASDGDDGNAGTLTSPLRSIEFAFENLPSGSVACVAAGEYFYGADADGIVLGIAGKEMTFVLESFAGNSEIRFSEKEFVVDTGAGTIRFQAGSASELVFGSGVVNSDDPAEPSLLNFLHTVRFASGSIDFTGVAVSLEASVGVPGFVNPDNPVKVAPADARVEFSDAEITGQLSFADAERSFLFSGLGSETLAFPLPASLSGQTLSFENANRIEFPEAVDLGTGGMTFGGSGEVAFVSEVSFEPGVGSIATLPSHTGSVEFSDLLTAFADVPGASALSIDGDGSVEIEMFRFRRSGTGGDLVSSIRKEGSGNLILHGFERFAGADGSVVRVDLLIEDGTVILGNTGAGITLLGPVVNRGRIELISNVELAEMPGEVNLLNDGEIDISNRSLLTPSAGSIINNDGVIGGAPGGSFLLNGPDELTGQGSVSRINVSGTGARISLPVFAGNIEVGQNASVSLGPLDMAVSGQVSGAAGSSISLLGASVLSVSEGVNLTDAALSLDPGSSILLSGDFVSRRSTVAATGTVRFVGTGPQVIFGAGNNVFLPNVFIDAPDVRFDIDVTFGSLSILSGRLSSLESSLTIDGSSSMSDGVLGLSGENASLDFAGPATFSGGEFIAPSVQEIRIGGDLTAGDTSFRFPDSGLIFDSGSTQTLRAESQLVLPDLSIDPQEPDTKILIDGPVTVENDLRLETGRIVLQEESVFSVTGSVLRTGGVLTAESSATLRLSGTGPQTISGFSGVVLPSILSVGASVQLEENLSIEGTFDIAEGVVEILGGKTVSVSDSVTISGGAVEVSQASKLWSGGPLSIGSGALSVSDGSSIEVQSGFFRSGGVILFDSSVLRFTGTAFQTFAPGSDLYLHEVFIAGGAHVSVPGAPAVTLLADLTIEEDAVLDLGASSWTMTGVETQTAIRNDGSFSVSSGALVLAGPAHPTGVFVLGGKGVFGNLTIRLDSEYESVVLDGSGDPFYVSGQLFFESGGLDLRGSPLVLSSDNGTATIRRIMTDAAPSDDHIDGGLFHDTLGSLDFNPGRLPYDLWYEGDLTELYTVGPEFQSGIVRNLTINTPDPINTPAVFGFIIPQAAALTGGLTIGPGSLLRLPSSDLFLSGDDVSHFIDGRISGSGVIFLIGSGASMASSSDNSGILTSLRLNAPAPSGTTRISGLSSIDNLTIESGSIQFASSGSNPRPLQITSSFSVDDGFVDVARSIRVGTDQSAGTFSASGGTVAIGDAVDLSVSPGSTVSLTESVTLIVNEEMSTPGIPQGGYITFEGNGQLQADAPIPRLKFDPQPSADGSDDVFLTGDTRVEEAFVMNGGDLFLGSSTFTLQSGVFSLDPDGVPTDGQSNGIFGDFASPAGTFVLGGPVELLLGSRMELISASLVIDAAAGDTIRVQSLFEDPARIVVLNKAFRMTGGILDLGLNDLILSGTIEDVLSITGGTIVASGAPSLPEKHAAYLTDPSLFPFLDSEFGEVVLTGTGSASIDLALPIRIPNLRINGTVSFNETSEALLVGSRLVFGGNGASILTQSAGQLQIDDAVQIIRRGRGTLSHDPEFLGSVDVFYDLDDGAVTGSSTGFGPGILSTGRELPGAARNLGILAGDESENANTVKLSSDLNVGGTLALFSGLFDLGEHSITFADNSRLILDELDAGSPPDLISGGGGYHTAGRSDLIIAARTRDVRTSETLFPAAASIGRLSIELGDSDLQNTVGFLLHEDRDVQRFNATAVSEANAFNLNGKSLRVASDLSIVGGSFTSGPVATLEVAGSAVFGSDAVIRGGVIAEVQGSIDVGGRFDGLLIQAGGDLSITGEIGEGVALIFNGSDQRLLLDSDATVQSLTLNQNGGTSGSPSVRLESSAGPVRLGIRDELSLESGILETGNNTLVLSGEDSGFTRSVETGNTSHVVGRVEREIAAETAGSFIFPVGDASTYRPLTLVFASPLISDSRFLVSHSGLPPTGLIGFPLTSGGLTLRGTSPYSWTLTSSVNFGQSQDYDISVMTESGVAGSIDEHRLIRRNSGNAAAEWSTLGGSVSVESAAGGFVIEHDGVKGGLNPSGSELALGSPESRAVARSAIQLIDLDASPDPIPIRIQMDGRDIYSGLTYLAASPEIPVALFTSTLESHLFELIRVSDGSLIAYAAVDLEDGHRTSVVVTAEGNEPLSIRDARIQTTQPAQGQSRIQLANMSSDLASVSLGLNENPLFVGIQNASFSTPAAIPSAFSVFDLTETGSGELIDQYLLDLTPFDGAVLSLVLSGYLAAPAEPGPSRDLSLSAVLANGSVLPLRVVTGVDPEDPAAQLPTAFVLKGNYPNPFNPTTTLLFDLPESADVRVTIVDMLGRVAARLNAGSYHAGANQRVIYDASRLASGMYLYRIEARSVTSFDAGTGKMIVLK